MRVTPRRFSSLATLALTVVFGTPRRRAAPLKLPACTTFTNIAMPSSSMGRHYAAAPFSLSNNYGGTNFRLPAPVQAQGARSGEDKEQEHEAVQRGQLAAVQHRRQDVALRRVRHEVGDGHESRQHEGGRPGEQAN